MALPNAYAQYNNSKVLTATPAELTLMLYEGAIKFCNIAIVAVEKKDVLNCVPAEKSWQILPENTTNVRCLRFL